MRQKIRFITMKFKYFFILISVFQAKSHINADTIHLKLSNAEKMFWRTSAYKTLTNDSCIRLLNHSLFKTVTKPRIQLSSALPNYNRNISSVIQPTGDELFISRDYISAFLKLSASQFIPFSGGTIELNSQVSMQTNLAKGTKHIQYYLNLFNISYKQNLLGFNEYPWNKKIENLSIKNFHQNHRQEIIKIQSNINYLYFKLIYNKLHKELQSKYIELKTITLNNSKWKSIHSASTQLDVIDADIQLLKAMSPIYENNNERITEEFNTYLNMKNVVIITEKIENIPIEFDINYELIYNETINNTLRLYEEEDIKKKRELARIKALKLPSINLSLGGGINNNFLSWNKSFRNLSPQLNATITIGFPVFDGNENKLRTEILINELSKIETNKRQQEIQVYQEISNCYKELSEKKYEYNISSKTIALLNDKLKILTQKYEQKKIDFMQIILCDIELLKEKLNLITITQKIHQIRYKIKLRSLVDLETV